MISVALTRYPHTLPWISGAISTEDLPVSFINIEGRLIETFRKMSRELCFDVSELGISTALIARDLGMPIRLLPVFVTRRFDHEAIFINKNKVRTPSDLQHGTIGLRSYTVTDAVWSRAALSEVFGIDSTQVNWVVTGDEHIEGSRLPQRVRYQGGDLDAMLEAGEIDASLNPYKGSAKHVEHLFPDFVKAEHDWFQQHGYMPIHHVIVIHERALDHYPEAPTKLFAALDQAKRIFLDELHKGTSIPPELDMRHAYGVYRIEDRLADDPVPYGKAENYKVLEDVVRFAQEQQMIADHWTVDNLFLEVS